MDCHSFFFFFVTFFEKKKKKITAVILKNISVNIKIYSKVHLCFLFFRGLRGTNISQRFLSTPLL